MIQHLKRWGLEVHVGSPINDASMSEVLFCATTSAANTHPSTFDRAYLSDIDMPRGLFMHVVNSIKYLGSLLARDCSDTHDVGSRIESSGKVFVSLHRCVFAPYIIFSCQASHLHHRHPLHPPVRLSVLVTDRGYVLPRLAFPCSMHVGQYMCMWQGQHTRTPGDATSTERLCKELGV